ncbi:nucleotide-binding universal stress UspA family protein [Kribbella amoyensis]|uniref:Nucleotide-binding universal stress UspA family protein n=1 Tax=Kribbella amoyensis TaxID=996641 RepID=A0A561AZK0_9ACTN|nr:universal stress protein [Kribbella amoyensis]TWD72033.1 nucleotide-binding universal stress UspA family protein [Kribbella amoyensis]
MTAQTSSVVVGYDGSPGAEAALEWATAEAVRLLLPLRIVEASALVVSTEPRHPGKVVPLAALRTARERGLRTLANGIRGRHPGLTVETLLVEGGPAQTLIEETAHARLVVLGSRGLGGWSGLLVGSVAVQVGTHAQCPVVVIPPDVRPRARERTVVVGVDGSKTSARAIDFAFDQAAAIGAKIIAVHAWSSPFMTHLEDGRSTLQFEDDDVEESSRLLVAESVAGAVADHPDVPWQPQLVDGHPARAILAEAQSADLVVVGSRGRGGFTGLLLGSVGQSVLHHAPCPVAIVR